MFAANMFGGGDLGTTQAAGQLVFSDVFDWQGGNDEPTGSLSSGKGSDHAAGDPQMNLLVSLVPNGNGAPALGAPEPTMAPPSDQPFHIIMASSN